LVGQISSFVEPKYSELVLYFLIKNPTTKTIKENIETTKSKPENPKNNPKIIMIADNLFILTFSNLSANGLNTYPITATIKIKFNSFINLKLGEINNLKLRFFFIIS
tara:strand:+ start:234 stop:554 length:321 start_codon:yes stop_codon:yes gene_type:complete